MRVNVANTNRHPLSAILGTRWTIPRSKSFVHLSRPQPPALRRSCSATYDHFHAHDYSPPFPPPPPPSRSPTTGKSIPQKFKVSVRTEVESVKPTSFCPSNTDPLVPSLLGIRPEPPDWPAKDEVMRDEISRKANSVDLPLSLRMLKKKKQSLKDDDGEEIRGGAVDLCAEKKAFASAVHAVGEIQRQALRMRGISEDEDMDGIIWKMQREMNSSFVWLFREVFSRTPSFMVNVMVLVTDFAAYSTGTLTGKVPIASNLMEMNRITGARKSLAQTATYPGILPREITIEEKEMKEEKEDIILDGKEMELWNSMVDKASRIQETELGGAKIDHGAVMQQQFVAPVSVEIEPDDDYVEYSRTDLLYRMGLAKDPHSPLLLSNYAQFLYLVSHDYDR
ncbi:hypothetical protein Dimus_022734 [Dionaea muscipula]